MSSYGQTLTSVIGCQAGMIPFPPGHNRICYFNHHTTQENRRSHHAFELRIQSPRYPSAAPPKTPQDVASASHVPNRHRRQNPLAPALPLPLPPSGTPTPTALLSLPATPPHPLQLHCRSATSTLISIILDSSAGEAVDRAARAPREHHNEALPPTPGRGGAVPPLPPGAAHVHDAAGEVQSRHELR